MRPYREGQLIADGQEPADILGFQSGGEAQGNEPEYGAAENSSEQTGVARYRSGNANHAGRHDRSGEYDTAAVQEFEVEAVGSPDIDPDAQRCEALGRSISDGGAIRSMLADEEKVQTEVDHTADAPPKDEKSLSFGCLKEHRGRGRERLRDG